MITFIDQIFKSNKYHSTANTSKLWLKPYEILSTGPGCGIIEFIPDAFSIDYIKKKGGGRVSLMEYFV